MKKPFVLLLSAITLFWAIGESAYQLRRNYRPTVPAITLASSMVYVTTETGQYHAAYCRFVDSNARPMPQKEAERARITPCLKCGG